MAQRGFFWALWLALFSVAHACFAQTPSITRCEPLALQVGATNQLVLVGDNLQKASNLWTSFRCTTRLIKAEDSKATMEVIVPPQEPLGVYALRLVTTNSISSLHLVFLDDLRTVPGTNDNVSLAKALEVTPPVAIDSIYPDNTFQYFKFKARAGELLSFEIVAHRLGKTFDGVLRLLDARGKELLYCDDDPGIGPDSRFSHRFAESGIYHLELRDTAYSGGNNVRYHLRIGNFPLVTTVWPPGSAADIPNKFSFHGKETSGLKETTAKLSGSHGVAHLNVRGRHKNSGYATIQLGRSDELAEIEPNETLGQAQKIKVPGAVSGRFTSGKDRDHYQFEATAGETIQFVSETRSINSPCDLFLRILKRDGSMVAESNPTAASQAAITNKFKEAGTHFLAVTEISGQNGPGMVYRLTASPTVQAFRLSVETDRVQADGEGNFKLKVTAARSNYTGPITLAFEGLDATLENHVIPEKKNDTELKAQVKRPVPAVHFGVVGTAKVGDSEARGKATTEPALKKLWPLILFPSSEWDGLIGLGQ